MQELVENMKLQYFHSCDSEHIEQFVFQFWKFEYLSKKTLGFTGADIEILCKEAALKAIKPYVPSLKTHTEKVPANVLEKIEVNPYGCSTGRDHRLGFNAATSRPLLLHVSRRPRGRGDKDRGTRERRLDSLESALH